MSCQRGNASRSRSQKHQNQKVFKNNMHDTSHKIKFINSIDVVNVCERCKQIIEWKIKYKKYKMLKAPVKCIKCEQKSVKQSYHNICLPCVKQCEVCAKCGLQKEIVEGKPTKAEQLKLDAELQALLKTMSERKRRTFIRYMNQQSTKKKKHKNDSLLSKLDTNKDNGKDANDDGPKSREDLLSKLKSLAIAEDDDDDSEEFNEDDTFDSKTDSEENDNSDNL